MPMLKSARLAGSGTCSLGMGALIGVIGENSPGTVLGENSLGLTLGENALGENSAGTANGENSLGVRTDPGAGENPAPKKAGPISSGIAGEAIIGADEKAAGAGAGG